MATSNYQLGLAFANIMLSAVAAAADVVGGMSVQFTKGSSGNSRHFTALGALGKIA